MQQSQIKPWHIILFTLAIILVMWQAFAYVKQRQQQQTHWQGEQVATPNLSPYAPPQIRQIREQMERDK